MRRAAVLIASLFAMCALATRTTPAQIDLAESWDGYAPGTGDPAYLEHWSALPGARLYEIMAPESGETPSVWSAPNSLKLAKELTFGIARSLLPEIEAAAPGATEILGTDDNRLVVTFYADLNKGTSTEDIFVEIAKGDAHVDETSGTEKDVLAFGVTNAWFPGSASPYFFDGRDWVEATGVFTGDRWNFFTLEIAEEEITIRGAQKASGEQTMPRVYLGGFDRISIRTIRIPDSGKRCAFDNLFVQGGECIGDGPEPELFRRGDADANGDMEITDAILTLGHLFLGDPEPSCLDAADADDNEALELTDAVYLLGHLFLGEPAPPEPVDSCGADPEGDELDCGSYPPCDDS